MGSDGAKHYQMGQNMGNPGQLVSKGAKQDQIEPNGQNMGNPGQMVSNRAKWGQSGPNGVTILGLVGDQFWIGR